MEPLRLHASCIAIKGRGVLLLGESGEGKSDLSLRLIDRGATLVADDQVILKQSQDKLEASPAESLAGLMEIRGVGIFQMPHLNHTPVALAVQLTRKDWIERLPFPEPFECLGVRVPKIRIWAFEPSAAIKVEMALAALDDNSMTVGALKE